MNATLTTAAAATAPPKNMAFSNGIDWYFTFVLVGISFLYMV
jgi:hypothetical protein